MMEFKFKLLFSLLIIGSNCCTLTFGTTLKEWLDQENIIVNNQEIPIDVQLRALASKWNTTQFQTDSMNLIRLAWWKMDVKLSQSFMEQAKDIKLITKQLIMDSRPSFSQQCEHSLIHWIESFGKLEYWAFTMWLAWGNLPRPGFLQSAYQDEGSPRTCFNVNRTIDANLQLQNGVKYCKLQFAPIVSDETLELSSQSDPMLTTRPVEIEYNLLQLKTQLFQELSHKSLQLDFQQISIGSCWPQDCSVNDIQSLIGLAASRFALKPKPVQCLDGESQKTQQDSFNGFRWQDFTLSQRCLMFFAIISIICATISTILDYTIKSWERNQKLDIYFVNIFSIRRNLKFLIDVRSSCDLYWNESRRDINDRDLNERTHQFRYIGNRILCLNSEHLSCLDGFKLITLLWIIYSQTLFGYGKQNFMFIYNKLGFFAEFLMISPFMHPDLAIDTLYLIAGLLSCYTLVSLTSRHQAFNNKLALHVITRNLMLTPSHLITIICFTMLPKILDQPFYWQFTNSNKADQVGLFEYIYLQPYVNINEIYMSQIIWPLIEITFLLLTFWLIKMICQEQRHKELHYTRYGIYHNRRYNKSSASLNKVLIFASLCLGSYYQYSSSVVNGKWPALVQHYALNQQIGVLHRPHLHATAFFIGIAIGRKLYGDLRKKVQLSQSMEETKQTTNTISYNGDCQQLLNKKQITFGWIECLIGLVVALWAFHQVNTYFLHSNNLISICLYQFCKVTFALSVSWMIYICALGHGGELNYIMSHENLKYLSKLIDIIFVSQMLIIYLQAGKFERDFESFTLNLVSKLSICDF